MKSKKKIIIRCLILAVVVLLIALFIYSIVRNKDPYSFEKRMEFSIPENAEVTIFMEEISRKKENVYLKFTIPEEDVDEFIKDLEVAHSLQEPYEDMVMPNHRNSCDEWDMDNSKIDKIYGGFGTRKQGNRVYNATYRLHKSIYILKPENGTVTVYLAYSG